MLNYPLPLLGVNMPHRLSLLFAASLLTLLIGCAGTPVSSSATTADLKGKAVVILSVSHDAAANEGAKAIFYLDTDRYPGRVVMTSVQDVLSVAVKSDFDGRRGHLYVLELEPGVHAIDGWQVASAGARISSKVAMPLGFEVRLGEALYLGNLHAKLELGHTMLFGGRAAYDAMPVVADRQEEDIRLALTKFPALSGSVRVALLPLGPWSSSAERNKKMDPIPMPFTPKK